MSPMFSSRTPSGGLTRTGLMRTASDALASASAVRPTKFRGVCPTHPTPTQHRAQGGTVPEFYPSTGEAIGAAMQHNIRLAYGGKAPGPDAPLRARHLPHPSADPYSVPGMIARLTETATPYEVAGIIEEVNGTLVGALPQLTELVAAAADWTRARLTFENPHHNPTFETWTRLAAATRMLRDVQEELEVAEDMIAACPAELSDPRYLDEVPALRIRELLSDVLGDDAVADTQPSAAQSPEAGQQRATRASSPHAAIPRTAPFAGTTSVPPTSAPPSRSPRAR